MGLADAVRFITFKDLNWVHVRAAKGTERLKTGAEWSKRRSKLRARRVFRPSQLKSSSALHLCFIFLNETPDFIEILI